MKALILYSSSSFPLSAVAGAIYLKKISPGKPAADLWDLPFTKDYKKYSLGCMCYLGRGEDGTEVVAFSARSGRIILKNLIETFLKINGIDTDHCRVREINLPVKVSLLLGEILLSIPFSSGAGKKLLEKYINRVYPQLAQAVKLDCNFQISDN
ncbi:MAG: DUF3189 family protein [Bacillota bacterium]